MKLKDLKVGKFLKEKAPDVLDVVGDLLPDSGALGIVKNVIDKVVPEDEKGPILHQLEIQRMEFEREILELEVKDRQSAREREVELEKAGGSNRMMYLSGYVALGVFVITIMFGLFNELGETQEKIYFHILGITEGVALQLFNYYYGTSKKEE